MNFPLGCSTLFYFTQYRNRIIPKINGVDGKYFIKNCIHQKGNAATSDKANLACPFSIHFAFILFASLIITSEKSAPVYCIVASFCKICCTKKSITHANLQYRVACCCIQYSNSIYINLSIATVHPFACLNACFAGGGDGAERRVVGKMFRPYSIELK